MIEASSAARWLLLPGGRLGSRRIDHIPDLRNAIGRKAATLGVLAYRFLIGSDVNAIELVSRDVAVQPLNLRSHALEGVTGFLGNSLQLALRPVPGSLDISLNNVLGHRQSP